MREVSPMVDKRMEQTKERRLRGSHTGKQDKTQNGRIWKGENREERATETGRRKCLISTKRQRDL